MRALIAGAGAALALTAPHAWATPELEATYRLGYLDSRYPSALTRADTRDQRPASQSVQNTIGLSAKKLAPDFDLGASFILEKPDYTISPLTDRRGTPYSPESRTEAQVSLIGTYTYSGYLASLEAFGHVTDSPYALRGGESRLGKSFYDGSTWLFVDGTYFSQNRPSDFYINSAFKTVERPRDVHGYQVGTSVEQFFTERWKGRLRFSSSRRVEERPLGVGIELSQGYAFTQRWFGKFELKRFQELRGGALQDERGYFNASQVKGELTFEPVFDLYLSASYALTAETESDPRTGRDLRVGSDQYGLGVRYPFRHLVLDAQGAYATTNTATSSVQLTGGITWLL